MIFSGRLAAIALGLAMALSACRQQPPEETRPAPTTQMAIHMAEAAVPPGFLRIGSWNMNHLGPSRQTHVETRSPEELATYIARSGAALVALQEVGETPGTPRRNQTLDSILKVLADQGGGTWEYLLFPTQHIDQSAMTGILWNTNLVARRTDPWPIPIERSNTAGIDDTLIWERLPYATRFSAGSGKADFVIIPIHTRSTRAGDDISVRVHEIRLLGEALESIRSHFGDRDLVLLGDFNTLVAGETTNTLLLQRGFRDLNRADEMSYLSQAPYDRAFVPANQSEFAETPNVNLVRVPGLTPAAFRNTYSDHYMITFDIRASSDDD